DRGRSDRTDEVNVRRRDDEHHEHVELRAYVLPGRTPEQRSSPILSPFLGQVPDVRNGARIICGGIVVRQGVVTWPVPGGGHVGFARAILPRECGNETPRGRTLEQSTACRQRGAPVFELADDTVAMMKEVVAAFHDTPLRGFVQIAMDFFCKVWTQGVRNQDGP